MSRDSALHRWIGFVSAVLGIFVFATGIVSVPDLTRRLSKSSHSTPPRPAETHLKPPASVKSPSRPVESHKRTLLFRKTSAIFGDAGPVESFSLLVGREVPRGSGDFVVDVFGSQLLADGASIYAAGPIGFETVTRCPKQVVKESWIPGWIGNSNYGSYIPLGVGHVYCLSFSGGKQYAKLVVDDIEMGPRGQYGPRLISMRYAIQRDGSTWFR